MQSYRSLVTGARGFVGRWLVPFLAAQGITGTATGRELPHGSAGRQAGLTRDDVLGVLTAVDSYGDREARRARGRPDRDPLRLRLSPHDRPPAGHP